MYWLKVDCIMPSGSQKRQKLIDNRVISSTPHAADVRQNPITGKESKVYEHFHVRPDPVLCDYAIPTPSSAHGSINFK